MNVQLPYALDRILRSVLVAVGYLLVLFGSSMLFVSVGWISAEPSSATFAIHWFFLSALVMALSLGPLASRIQATLRRHTLIWGSVLYLNIASVVIEGAFFAPDLLDNPKVILVQQLVICAVTGALIAGLFADSRATFARQRQLEGRSWLSWIWRFLAAVSSYLFFYFVFGALNYAFITSPYYAENPQLSVPNIQTILAAESIRAVLIVLSLVPFLMTAKMPVGRLALWSGFVLFTIGGVVPLFWQIGNLPVFLLVASGWEILAQNFLTGVVAANLLAPASLSVSGHIVPHRTPYGISSN